jgi:chromosome segregation ATPase
MKRAFILTFLACALASAALAQAPLPNNAPPPSVNPPPATGTTGAAPEASPPAVPETTETAPADTQGARETPLDTEPFDVRVHRRLEEYTQRRAQREAEMNSYAVASGSDPGLERFADPRKVQAELKDELDREQTSEQLANDYAEQAREVLSKEQAVQDFIAKRRKTLDDLSKQIGSVNRQDLEVALANLARQPDSPEIEAQMRDIDRRLSEAERLEKELPARQARAQQEAAGAAEELAKLQALQQSYEQESKAFAADALSAHNNRLGLADRLEYYLVRAQAEDVLEQGRKATQSVQHLSASPEVDKTLNSSGSPTTPRSDTDLERLKSCIQQSGDVQACHEKARQPQPPQQPEGGKPS